MNRLFRRIVLLAGLSGVVSAAPLAISVRTPAAAETAGFKMGTSVAGNGDVLTLDSRSLLLNGRRWTPVMGEYHYSRYAAAEWRHELQKMRAGGVDIVATYVFWNHHEETEGVWEWGGDRDLRRFVRLAGEVGLKVIVRCGPWCHGEVRNGGVPDWAIAKGWKLRSDDPPYLEQVRQLYGQIATQLSGLLWKEDGPVIGIQLENEYSGPAEHLLNLKKLAQAAGLDVPLYTRTGWPQLKTPMPFGEIVPLYGVYAEGFWDRETTVMPGRYWAGFHFSTLRIDANIANEALGRADAKDAGDVARYPYLTCEIGGGMMSSYHRRILVAPRDMVATTLVKLGSGSVSPGYYMYHGGTNPEGRHTTLMEQQDSPMTNWNDMPVKNYDFQAPLGQYGQIRPQYRLLRRLHLFLHDFGPALAGMDAFMPERRPEGKADDTTLRWSVRSDGRAGFVFVNNYERARTLPAKMDVQFAVRLADGSAVVFPEAPVEVPADDCFFWPFNLSLGHGIELTWATAQPLATSEKGDVRTVWFAETPGVAPVFALAGRAPVTLQPGREHGIIVQGVGGDVRIVLLTMAESLALERHARTGELGFEGAKRFARPVPVGFMTLAAAGPLRRIELGKIKQPVAAAPTDADFAQAAVWRIELQDNVDPAAGNLLLRFHYVGDVARIAIGGRFVTDDFYNGRPVDLGLSRYADELKTGEITLAVLPLQRGAITGEKPLIYLPEASRPDFGGQESVVRLDRVELVEAESPAP